MLKIKFITFTLLVFVSLEFFESFASHSFLHPDEDLQVKQTEVKQEQTFELLSSKILEYIRNDLNYEALNLINRLTEGVQSGNIKFGEKNKDLQQRLLNDFYGLLEIKRLLMNKKTFQTRYEQFNNLPNWNRFIDMPTKKIYQKREEGYDFITQYIEYVIDAPYMNVLMLFQEVDLYPTWIPRVTEAKIIKQFSDLRKAIYIRYNAPWPLKDRELISEQTGFLLNDKGEIILTDEQVQDGNYFGVEVQRTKGVTELISKNSLSYMRPVSANQTVIKIFLNQDPQLDYIPNWFIDWLLKQVTSGTYNHVQDVCQNLPDVYYHRYLEKKDFYDRLFKRTKFMYESIGVDYEWQGPERKLSSSKKQKKKKEKNQDL